MNFINHNVHFQDGFRMFLGITTSLENWSSNERECTLVIDDNPLTTFTELPEEHSNLCYCNIYCGAVRGALELVRFVAIHSLFHVYVLSHML